MTAAEAKEKLRQAELLIEEVADAAVDDELSAVLVWGVLRDFDEVHNVADRAIEKEAKK